MIARWLAREFRDFPATMLICLSWILVFAAMTIHGMLDGDPPTMVQWAATSFGGGVSFGDMSVADLSRGQVWRLMTCNFIHYSLLHIVLNLMAMYQLGSLLESWYGSYQLLYLYGVTGGGGNLISAMARWWMNSNRQVHSAGGSVAIMGLVGICAVGAWRSTIPEGRRLARLMLIFIALTAALGAALPDFIDNWGHAGGLIVGLVLGLGHRRLIARVGKPSAWGAGMLTVLVFVGAAAAQFVAERREAPLRQENRLVLRTEYMVRATRDLGALMRRPPSRKGLIAASRWLEILDRLLEGETREEARAVRALIVEATGHPLDEEDRRELDERLARLLERMGRDYAEDRRALSRLRNASKSPRASL